MSHEPTNVRVVITGMGIVSPIGHDADQILASVLRGETAVRPLDRSVRGKPVFAGRIAPGAIDESIDDPKLDRTGRIAIEAARRALRDANGDAEVDPRTIGLALGSSHGGRSQLDRLAEEDGDPFSAAAAARFAVVSAHHVQTEAVVSSLKLGGPVVTLSNACSSSGSALEIALDWIRSGRCPQALAGGADGYAHLTQAGFAALGATSHAANAPFSLPIGISLGEAAGFVVLESLDHALARGATIHAELFACASTYDAYHLTEPEPSGDGLGRALSLAHRRAGWELDRIGFVHAHGTGTRLNDTAECRALERFFGDNVPPVCSSKAMTGHVLGASAVVGLVVGVVAMNHGLIPPTVNFTEPRPGCPFDFVPNVAREEAVSGFAVQVAGFGGINAVAMVGLPSPRNVPGARRAEPDDVVITGVGVVSGLGLDARSTADALASGRSAIGPLSRFNRSGFKAGHASEVDGPAVRKLAARLGLKRADPVVEYAAVAAAEACRQAGLQPLTDGSGERVGLAVGTTRGEAGRFELYLESARGGAWDSASPLHFPHLVMSALGGQVSKVLGLKGTAFTIVDGDSAGLHALCHAVEALRSHDDLDAMVVVAADELTARYFGCLDTLGRYAPTEVDGAGSASRPYDSSSLGIVPGEAGVALVLERAATARARGAKPLARVAGYGLAAASGPGCATTTMARATATALAEGTIDAASIDLVVGCGRGLPGPDRAEADGISLALKRRSHPCPATGSGAFLGSPEAASGLLAVASALASMSRGEAPPVSKTPPPSSGTLQWVGPGARPGDYPRVLVAGASDAGNSAAVVLERVGTDDTF